MTKIIYDSENKSDTINCLNICINDLSSVNEIFYNMELPYDFKYKNMLTNIKDKLNKDKIDLCSYKNDIVKYIDEINKNELEIISSINDITEILIDKF